jgi:tetratricopeptide (TPR) repeat protein
LYYALKEGGIESALKRFHEIKNNKADEYAYRGVDILIIGDKLLKKKRYDEAIVFLELALDEFPEDEYAYYTNYNLAVACKETGDVQKAVMHCERAIELNADFQAAVQLLEELKM